MAEVVLKQRSSAGPTYMDAFAHDVMGLSAPSLQSRQHNPRLVRPAKGCDMSKIAD